MLTKLTGVHRSTYSAIFQHPMAHNLHWRDVRSMLAAVAEVMEEPNGNLKVTRGEQTLVLRPSLEKDVADIEELVKIRHFLERSGGAAPATAEGGTNLLVVIDHREARVYSVELHGTVPQRITPYSPLGVDRHLHYVEDEANGQRKPECKSFYEEVAKTLQAAAQILLFGSGTGASSAMEQLYAELKHRHPQLAERIVGRVVVDEQHLTDAQLLAKARDFYAKLVAVAPKATLVAHK